MSAKNTHLFWTRNVSKMSTQSQGSGGSWSQTFPLACCHRVSSPSVSAATGIGRVLVAKGRTVVAFAFACCPRVSEMSTCTRIRGSWSRNAELSSLLTLCLVVASQKCQQSHLECIVHGSSKGFCGDATVDCARRRSWKDLSGTSQQEVLKKVPKARKNGRLHAYMHSGVQTPWALK